MVLEKNNADVFKHSAKQNSSLARSSPTELSTLWGWAAADVLPSPSLTPIPTAGSQAGLSLHWSQCQEDA